MNILFLILLMMLVTYIPRMLPSLITDKLRLNKKFKKYLEKNDIFGSVPK